MRDREPIERGFQKFERGGIVMRKVLCVAVLLVIMIGAASGIASAKTLYVVLEDEITNSTQTPADAVAVDVKLTNYNNQCMILTFSAEASVSGGPYINITFYPEIDGVPASPTFDAGRTYWYAPTAGFWDMVSFTWYMCGLDIGRHTVAIRYNPSNAGATANIGPRLLKIDIKSGKIVPTLTAAESEGAELEEE